jgi:hypothetical protein
MVPSQIIKTKFFYKVNKFDNGKYLPLLTYIDKNWSTYYNSKIWQTSIYRFVNTEIKKQIF